MIKVDFDPAALTGDERAWWDRWAARAAKRTEEYAQKRAAGEPCEFDGSIWSDLKSFLLDHVFHGKCAYCEQEISSSFFGSGEHFRPKGNVTVPGPAGKQVATLADGNPHGGYFWLAYDWRNLVPACDKCNNAKSDQFPVSASHAPSPAPSTDELNQAEAPLLLYPYRDEPERYLRFGKGGVVVAIDDNPRGAETIRVLDLNRNKLMDARWKAQSQALQALEGDVGRFMTDNGTDSPRFAEYLGPKARFSRAVHDWFLERTRLISARARKAAEAAARGS